MRVGAPGKRRGVKRAPGRAGRRSCFTPLCPRLQAEAATQDLSCGQVGVVLQELLQVGIVSPKLYA